jgi:type II secretory pathway component GspD/PulD (secretin)
MTLAHLGRRTLGALLALSASLVVMTGGSIEARPQAVEQAPIVSSDPEVQRAFEATWARLASVRLDPVARVGSLQFKDRPLREIVDAVAKAGGITVRYAPGMTGLDASSTITLPEATIEDALRAVLGGNGLTFQALGAKNVLVYPDTPANREKYTLSTQIFTVAKAEPVALAQQLNRALRAPTEPLQPLIYTVRDSRKIVVFASRERLTWVATWIAENDKEH